MKEYKKIWLNLMNAILGGALIVLGSSCEEVNATEYGTPYARYELKGKVINSKKETVSGIRVIVQGLMEEGSNVYKYNQPVVFHTNQEGSFTYKDGAARPDSKLRVIYEDINKNSDTGIYKTDSVDIDMGELSGKKGNWCVGEASKEITIQLTEKTSNGE